MQLCLQPQRLQGIDRRRRTVLRRCHHSISGPIRRRRWIHRRHRQLISTHRRHPTSGRLHLDGHRRLTTFHRRLHSRYRRLTSVPYRAEWYERHWSIRSRST
ncbi:hypothetical protein NDU88_008452 [Pleurodeles waltl]|uniref:Uncharacterized protein n=1 Tax=Pleurodeles waltl TaxID=8319 RepID=A0AAV7NW25_PLEWA|nr:hypothetical protein NDU88_008452 [Pleurodeles waltl]